jgi:predicted acyltransferase
MLAHACWRAFLLTALGIFLRSIGKPRTNFTFEDTLSQIGMGYVFLFFLAFVPVRAQLAALAALLVGYWALFALYPAPAPDFDYASVGVRPDWPHHYSGFLSHWNKNSNAAWAFDTWFLNLFPREQPFLYNGGGYATLSFIPTLGTMLLGLLAGEWIRSPGLTSTKLRGLLAAGAVMILGALALQWTGICPIVKRIWTPAFTLYSGGWVVLILAAIFAITEVRGWRRWAFPLIVIGANSIAVYVMSWTMEGFISAAVARHLGLQDTVGRGAAVLAIFWSILFWMYRRKIFLRI